MILGVILFAIAIAGISYAWIKWQSGNTKIKGSTECFTINHTNGQTLSTNNIYLFDEAEVTNNNRIMVKDGMAFLNVTASMDSSCNIMANLNIELDVTELDDAFISGDSVGALKLVLAEYDPSVYNGNDLEVFKNQEFEIKERYSISSKGLITFEGSPIETTNKGYLLIFYVDGNLAYNSAANTTFKTTIKGVASQIQ